MPPGGAGTWLKMAGAGALLCIGGPALVMWVTPTEEEIFKRYSPELQKKALEERPKREKELQEFARQMIEYSKSDKPIWVLQAEDAKRKRKEAFRAERERLNKERDMKEAMLREQMFGDDDDDVSAPAKAK